MSRQPHLILSVMNRPAFLILLFLRLAAPRLHAEFAIHDGDTVVFLGDSITAAREYGKIIEDYTLLRFPERHVRFINAGKGGETAHGCLARLDRDVFAKGATLLTVAYGVNDIGWGMKADREHKHAYLDAIADIVDRCQQRHVRVFICSAAITAEDPETAEKGFLQRMCDEGLQLAGEKGAGTIDIQRAMRKVQRRVLAANAKEPDTSKQTRMHVADGVHLNDLGQFAMAFAILKGLGAPAEVSSATLDAEDAVVLATEHCRITDIAGSDGSLSFTRLDERLPLNLQPLWMLHGFFMPIGEELNQYLLSVKRLPAGHYEVTAGGRLLGKWDAAALERGINIASATPDPWQPGGPWDAQGHAVKIFTDMRDELALARRNMDQTLQSHPKREELRREADEMEKAIVDLQKNTARPVPVHFEVRRVN